MKSLAVAACSALLISLAPAVAVQAAPVSPDGRGETSRDLGATRAAGLIVRTSAPRAAVARASDAAAGDQVAVTDVSSVAPGILAVAFDTDLSDSSARQAAERVEQRTDVVWAIPDYVVQPVQAAPNAPNDKEFAKQYGLWDSRAVLAGGHSARAPYAWSSTKGAKSVVAVLDTGIVKAHPDLKNQLVAGFDMVSEKYAANDGGGRDKDPSDPGDWIPKGDTRCYGKKTSKQEDSSWHGTHVAGIIAAQQGNKIGISGIAPAAKIQPVRVLGRCGGLTSDILNGITWASGGVVAGTAVNATPADVINLSLGLDLYGYPTELDQVCEAFGAVVADAKSRGAVTVAAAGNEYDDGAEGGWSAPAVCPGVIAVAATGDDGALATYSNVGQFVDLAAPGGDTDRRRSGILSTLNSGKTKPSSSTYSTYNGTSMATPAVSGAAALLMSRGMPAEDVETALTHSTEPFAAGHPSLENYQVGYDGVGPVYRNLNCTAARCGSGMLDLSRTPLPVAPPVITGRAFAGEVLTASPGTWSSASPPNVLYQWTLDGSPIVGAYGSTYTLEQHDRGHQVAVRVRPARHGFASMAQTSRATASVGYTLEVVESPALVGVGLSGTIKVRVLDGNGPVDGKTVTFRRYSVPIGEATTDADGVASFTLDGSNLNRGEQNPISAAFSEDTSRHWSTSAVTVRYDKLTPTITQVPPTSAKAKKVFMVQVTVAAPGLTAVGKVRVHATRSGKTTHSKEVQLGADGTVLVPMTLSTKGTYKINATFAGNDQITYGNATRLVSMKII